MRIPRAFALFAAVALIATACTTAASPSPAASGGAGGSGAGLRHAGDCQHCCVHCRQSGVAHDACQSPAVCQSLPEWLELPGQREPCDGGRSVAECRHLDPERRW